jgi:transposase
VLEFRQQVVERLRAAIPVTNTRPVKVFAQDESRFGLRTTRRRRLTARGVQPVGVTQHDFQNFYVYGAVAPSSGEDFMLELPELNSTNFQVFLDAFARAHPDTLHLRVLDNSRCHTAKAVQVPANVHFVFLPPYSPELNPIERLWRDLKDQLAWFHVPDLSDQQDFVGALLRAYTPTTIQSLTGYTYFVEAVHALFP